MDSALINFLTIAGVVSTAAVCAPIVNRFRNVPGAICAIVGALLPWLIFATLCYWRTSTALALALVGLAFITSSLLFALLFYSVEEPGATRAVTLAVIGVAICAWGYLAVLVAYSLLLARV